MIDLASLKFLLNYVEILTTIFLFDLTLLVTATVCSIGMKNLTMDIRPMALWMIFIIKNIVHWHFFCKHSVSLSFN